MLDHMKCAFLNVYLFHLPAPNQSLELEEVLEGMWSIMLCNREGILKPKGDKWRLEQG